ncbi:MAG: ATP-binding protein [Aeoliella sp.]
MFRNRLQLGFPRQVVSCYLLFCMVAVSWLSVGVVFTVHAILSSRTEGECLSQLGKAAAAIEIEHLRNGEESLEPLIDRIRGDGRFTYCAVVNPAGEFIAHTNRHLTGAKAIASVGHKQRWGDVEATRYTAANARTLVEFRVPLKSGDKSIGAFWVAVPAPDFWSTASAAAEAAPLAILVPLVLVGVGALTLKRLAQPLASVHDQLAGIGRRPASATLETTKLPPKSAVHLGWNRIVDSLGGARQENQHDGVSERVAAAIKGRKSNESQQILESLSDGLAVTDAEGRITFANRAIAALLGEHEDTNSANGCPISEYLSGRVDNPEALGVFNAAAERPARTEVSRSFGERKRVLRVARQPLGKGDAGHVWSLRDVTQQKLAEDMRSQFIDSATHELRTPLANIKAYSETLALMDDVDIEQQKEFCNTINKEATRLARFVDDLLSVSSMEVGSLSINRQNVDLARLFEEVTEKVRPLLVKKSQVFDVHVPEKLGEALLDKDKISAMLVNMLGNASKYTPTKGRVALHVKVANNVVSVGVEDSGVGIAPEELPHVFEKFFRSSDPRVQGEAGTGLGLSLAREIVRLHGGELAVKSKLNEGTTFVATLPLRREARL